MRDWKQLAEIVRLRHEGLFYEEIGQRLGLTKGRACRLYRWACEFGIDRVGKKADETTPVVIEQQARLDEIKRFNRRLRERAKERGLSYP